MSDKSTSPSDPSRPAPAEGREPDGWRCFHCQAFFADECAARMHFGNNYGTDPVCAGWAKTLPDEYRKLRLAISALRVTWYAAWLKLAQSDDPFTCGEASMLEACFNELAALEQAQKGSK